MELSRQNHKSIRRDKMEKEISELIERQLRCLHYRTCHYDNVRDSHPIGGCPHYNGGKCLLHEEPPQIFPEKCIALL